MGEQDPVTCVCGTEIQKKSKNTYYCPNPDCIIMDVDEGTVNHFLRQSIQVIPEDSWSSLRAHR